MNDRSAETDLATGMDDLNHAGFVVSKHHIKFETLDSQIAKAIMTDFMKKDPGSGMEKTMQKVSAQCSQAGKWSVRYFVLWHF